MCPIEGSRIPLEPGWALWVDLKTPLFGNAILKSTRYEIYVLDLQWIVAVLFGEWERLLFCWKCKRKRMYWFYSIKLIKVGIRSDDCNNFRWEEMCSLQWFVLCWGLYLLFCPLGGLPGGDVVSDDYVWKLSFFLLFYLWRC